MILAIPQKYSYSVLDLKKIPLNAQKIYIVLKTQRNIEIQDFEPSLSMELSNYTRKRCHPVCVLKGIKASDIVIKYKISERFKARTIFMFLK